MSSPPKESELLAGHPPAVKVAGGVRITQHNKPDPERKEKEKEAREDEKEEQASAATAAEQHRVVVSGAVAKGNKDFSDKAIKCFHEKPLPAVQVDHGGQQTRNIQQPRK